MPLKSLVEKKERPNDKTAEYSKPRNKKQAACKGKYQESYWNYEFIAKGNSHSPRLLWIICDDELPNEAIKPSKLLHHTEMKCPEFSKGKEKNTKDRNNYWHYFTKCVCISSIHSYWLTGLLKLRSPLLLVKSWSCMQQRTSFMKYYERLYCKRWHMIFF